MKKAFTLIEIMLAIMILSILLLAINNIIANLKSTKDFLQNISKRENKNELFIKTLYYDILNSNSMTVKHSFNSDYDRIYINTQNSLYGLINPYVVWYVSKKNNSLIRVESPVKITLPNDRVFFADKFAENVKIFKIFSKNKKELIFFQAANKKPLYFEMINKNYEKATVSNETNNSNDRNSTNKDNNNQKSSSNSFLPTF